MALMGSPPEPDMVESRQKEWDLDRCFAAFDDSGRMCGTTRTFATELTVPGGTTPAGAVSGVGVLPTHRRQGNLNALMQVQLADSIERGEPLSVLVAAEYPIYGRYGYGPTTEACGIRLDAPAPDEWLAAPTGRVELADNDTFRGAVRELYDLVRHAIPGHIAYDDEYWDVLLGDQAASWSSDKDRLRKAPRALWRDGDDRVLGAALYSVTESWERNRPNGTLSTDLFLAATDEAERELIRFLSSVDWVRAVRVGVRPVDDPLPLMLRDGRGATLIDRSDHIWARILDVPAALSARRYATAARLVLEVVDPLGLTGGRFALDAGPDGVDCAPTDSPADLVVPVAALGAAYLGGQSWGRLAAAGWVDESRPGAIADASALFSVPRAPFCAMTF